MWAVVHLLSCVVNDYQVRHVPTRNKRHKLLVDLGANSFKFSVKHYPTMLFQPISSQ